MSEMDPERLEAIRSKPFGDLSPSEQAEWMVADPGSYYTAARECACVAFQEEVREERRRRRAEFRRDLLWVLTFGRRGRD